ncbi:MAG: LysR family transcriptional regulator [Clostridia bacterium]|nr:LysR family transcriptional regulator [Clostridia bacterium]
MIDTKLYSLLRVYETGNFTRAAEQLSLTQPAVSQHIRTLEKELNVRIFERSSSELHVTNEGKMIIKCAKRIIALYNNLQRDLSSERRQITSMTVGITHTAESNAIAEALARYVNTHEGINIKLRTDTASNLCDLLRNYELDFAIIEGHIADPQLQQLMLDTDYLVLAVAPDHRLAGKSAVTIQDLKEEKMILRLPDSGTRNLFVASLEAQNMSIEEFNVVLEVDNIATIKDLIRRDFGVSVLARSACQDELRKNKIAVLPIENLSMMREINIVYSQDFDHPQVLQDIMKCYRDVQALSDESAKP